MLKTNLKIGISMRVTHAQEYEERRDSLAQDWPKYLMTLVPDAQWLFIPNIGKGAAKFAQDWGLNAFILTGGESLGISPERDETENAIFQYSQKEGYPILGICRGLQAIYSWLGGKVVKQNNEFIKKHTSAYHKILIDNEIRSVNSFHSNCAIIETMPEKLNVLATCIEDDSLEAFNGKNILCFMWHPEREEEPQEWETNLIRKFFEYE